MDALNEKLGRAVSVVPKGGAKLTEEEKGSEDDDSDTTEDMAPLFNRTVGTQTSPPPSPSTPSTNSPEPHPPDVISSHETSLQSLQALLSSLLPSSNLNVDTSKDVKSQLTDLNDYLNGLSFPAFRDEGSKDDAVNKLKADIRGVKGVLLSARNFPSGTGRGG